MPRWAWHPYGDGVTEADDLRVRWSLSDVEGSVLFNDTDDGRVAALVEIDRLLSKHLRAGAVAHVLRRPFDDAAGRSLPDVALVNPVEAAELTRAMFDWSSLHS
jgi:hypothetical protein